MLMPTLVSSRVHPCPRRLSDSSQPPQQGFTFLLGSLLWPITFEVGFGGGQALRPPGWEVLSPHFTVKALKHLPQVTGQRHCGLISFWFGGFDLVTPVGGFSIFIQQIMNLPSQNTTNYPHTVSLPRLGQSTGLGLGTLSPRAS